MKKTSLLRPFRHAVVRPILPLLFAVFAVAPAGLWANPNGGQVIAGGAAIGSAGSVLTITQTTDRAAINWNGFSIGAGETTRFVQPSSSSAVLNRVVGANLSAINGTLQANGQVYLINPNGILFGAGSVVNVAGFVASTLDVDTTQFLGGGDLHFLGASTARVTNLGAISVGGGNLFLIAKEVENGGTLSAPGGRVGLAGATDVVLRSGDHAQLLIQAPSGQGSVTNDAAGRIEAAAIALKAVGGNEYALAINNGGIVRATGTATVNGRVLLTAGDGMAYNGGTVSARTASGDGGKIQVAGRSAWNVGTLDASGANGGRISFAAADIENDGAITVQGTAGTGGSFVADFTGSLLGSVSGIVDARGLLGGGAIALAGAPGSFLYFSGTLDASSAAGTGGTVTATATTMYLLGATLRADGATGGGTVLVGGGSGGTDPSILNARDVTIGADTLLSADALDDGHGGQVVVWSDGTSEVLGTLHARGGANGGDGGSIEASGLQATYFGGLADAGAPHGARGTFLLDPLSIIVDASGASTSNILFEFVDPDPAAGNEFGDSILALSTGNVVVTSPFDGFAGSQAGAVYLFNGATGALISTLRGGAVNDTVGYDGVTALGNGNYVVGSSPWSNNTGAVTWGSGTRGVSGVVSVANSLVGSATTDNVGGYGVTVLSNGNYVVDSASWSGGLGAVTWGNGTSGTSGVVGAGNSLVGGTAGDAVGLGGSFNGPGVVALSNGNYVVDSSNWSNNTGAVTWGDGTTGTAGVVSAANSLVGSASGDFVGGSGVAALAGNGNYVVASPNWSNGLGAVTWGNGTTGTSGTIDASNSLVGGTAGDRVGSEGVLALSLNGNYVAYSPNWNGYLGAVTWGNGLGGTVGAVSASNSLVGSTSGDYVGTNAFALSNGNYVVSSPEWSGGTGAVTWGNGLGGTVGTINGSNSLVGGTAGDQVGYDGVTVLSNGNYVVASSQWSGGLGAVTWGDGTHGTTGTVGAGNSLVGAAPGDLLTNGNQYITVLSNGNYVVVSPNWNSGTGAVTWEDGTVVGTINASNSLVGGAAGDQVGSDGVTVLSNGNYVVASSQWNGSTGAVTWGSGTAGVHGAVSASNSLVGSTGGDLVGDDDGGYTVTALSNGNYVVASSSWSNGLGAATWGDGTTGTAGTISASNSIVGGSSAYDQVNVSADPVHGTYAVSFWGDTSAGGEGRVYEASADGPVAINPGLLTFGGTAYGAGPGASITITAATITAITDTGTDVVLQANDDIVVNQAIVSNNPSGNGGALTLDAGRSISLNASITTDDGNLTLVANDTAAHGVVGAHRDPGVAAITMGSGAAIDAGIGDVSITMETGAGNANHDAGDIALGSITAGAAPPLHQGGGDVVLNSGATVAASGTGDAIVLAAAGGGNFVNLSGAGALSAANGRWLVYSASAAGDTFGGLASGNADLSATYAGMPPGAVSALGNRYLFSPQTNSDSQQTGSPQAGSQAQARALNQLQTAQNLVAAAAWPWSSSSSSPSSPEFRATALGGGEAPQALGFGGLPGGGSHPVVGGGPNGPVLLEMSSADVAGGSL